jgi:hypothetical protein
VIDAARIALYIARRRRLPTSGTIRITTCTAWYDHRARRSVGARARRRSDPRLKKFRGGMSNPGSPSA